MYRQLDERVMVAGQISPGEIEALKDRGVVMVINNRPDDEEFGQPAGAEIEAAAAAAGVAYRSIPVSSGFSAEQVRAMAEALAQADGAVLAFCRSGTRSAFLWALARAAAGEDGEALIGKAAAAGYDLSPIRAFLQR